MERKYGRDGLGYILGGKRMDPPKNGLKSFKTKLKC